MDNTTPVIAAEYNSHIEKIMPNYNLFHQETIDLVKTINPKPDFWLDTGCGTGTFGEKALQSFGNKIRFVFADPAEAMLDLAKRRFPKDIDREFIIAGTQDLKCSEMSFDVITAILAHHYLNADMRIKATANCYRMLKTGGVYVTFENVRPNTEKGIEIGLNRWKQYQIEHGITEEKAGNHMNRFDTEYFPIPITSQINILKAAGFSAVEVLWVSHMQAGFFAIK